MNFPKTTEPSLKKLKTPPVKGVMDELSEVQKEAQKIKSPKLRL